MKKSTKDTLIAAGASILVAIITTCGVIYASRNHLSELIGRIDDLQLRTDTSIIVAYRESQAVAALYKEQIGPLHDFSYQNMHFLQERYEAIPKERSAPIEKLLGTK